MQSTNLKKNEYNTNNILTAVLFSYVQFTHFWARGGGLPW